MLVPLYGFVQGDTMGIVVLADDAMSLGEVAKKMADSASLRVDPAGPWVLESRGIELDPSLTVADAGLEPLCRVDLKRTR